MFGFACGENGLDCQSTHRHTREKRKTCLYSKRATCDVQNVRIAGQDDGRDGLKPEDSEWMISRRPRQERGDKNLRTVLTV